MKAFLLHRTNEDAKSTAGSLESDGEMLCATLERGGNDLDHPRIPAGEYPLILRPVPGSRFDPPYKKIFADAGLAYLGMIEIGHVPGRSAILFHMGNWWDQSLGCVLCGQRVIFEPKRGHYEIPPGESRPGFLRAYGVMAAAIKEGVAVLKVFDIKPVLTEVGIA